MSKLTVSFAEPARCCARTVFNRELLNGHWYRYRFFSRDAKPQEWILVLKIGDQIVFFGKDPSTYRIGPEEANKPFGDCMEIEEVNIYIQASTMRSMP